MYRNQYGKGDTLVQTIDFSTLRKTNQQPICKVTNNSLSFAHQPNSPLLLIGSYALIKRSISIHDSQFTDFPFENLPKPYQQYSHKKTASEIFNVLKAKSKSQESLAQLLNCYPILAFILECWVRKRAICQLDGHPPPDCMGNEHEILVDLGSQIRGPLLAMVASCFKLWLSIGYDIFPCLDCASSKEEFGDFASRWQLKIEYKSDKFVSGCIFQRDQDLILSLPSSKASECGYLRRSKVNDNEADVRSDGELKSARKERPVQCEKCGVKRCDCNQIKRKGFAATPKSNQLSSSTTIRSQPFAFGFLKDHNLCKMGESSSGQK